METKMEFQTKELDSQLRSIEGLKYLPWVGIRLLISESRTLIVGESLYNWGIDTESKERAAKALESENFARKVVLEQGISEPNPNRKFYRNIEKLLLGDKVSKQEREFFWSSVAFHELVQRPMNNKKARPIDKDYEIGSDVLMEIIHLIKPTRCIFLGTDWKKYASLKVSLSRNWNIEGQNFNKISGTEPKLMTISELKLKIYFVKHPSSFFNVSKWREFIETN